MKKTSPSNIFSGNFKEGHIQGIAVDSERGFVYYSFTMVLIKTDLDGKLVGSVERLAGHLGCITYDAERNRVYGSLELKHDVIGRGIVERTGHALADEDAFYLVEFDVGQITRIGMDAERDGIMRAVYLRDVIEDYTATDEVSGRPHRYGCSGIDGVALGPVFGEAPDSDKKIMVAYGIYREVDRADNDHQVILQFDTSVFDRFAQPLDQSAPHHSGPETCEARYFFRTGNTTFGVQNLEYDSHSRNWFVAVYPGQKEAFENFRMFAIDGRIAAERLPLIGRAGESGLLLCSAKIGKPSKNESIFGSHFLWGSTGMASLGDGCFYFSENGSIPEEKLFFSNLRLYRYAPDSSELFEAM